MPIFTFSTKGSKPKDTETIKRIKAYCEEHGLNFSSLIIQQLKEWEDDRSRKV